jgi:hypothetical protein
MPMSEDAPQEAVERILARFYASQEAARLALGTGNATALRVCFEEMLSAIEDCGILIERGDPVVVRQIATVLHGILIGILRSPTVEGSKAAPPPAGS